MRSRMIIAAGTIGTVAVMLAAMYAWQNARFIVLEWERPDVAYWSVRCAAIGLAAIAQVLLLTFVVGRIYGRDLLNDLLRLCCALVFMISLASAVALGVAGLSAR